MRFHLFFVAVSVILSASSAVQGASAGRGTQPPRTYGDVAAPTYGDVAAPKYGEVPTPTYGEVPAPKYDALPTTEYGEGRLPASGESWTAPESRERAGAPASSTPRPPTAERAPGALSVGYFYTDRGGMLHTWDFAADGTYFYTQVTKGAGFSGRTSERGTYRITGGILEVHPARQTGAAASGTTGGKTDALTAGSDAVTETRRYRIELLGPDGKGGAILDGVRMKTKSW